MRSLIYRTVCFLFCFLSCDIGSKISLKLIHIFANCVNLTMNRTMWLDRGVTKRPARGRVCMSSEASPAAEKTKANAPPKMEEEVKWSCHRVVRVAAPPALSYYGGP